MSKKKGIGGVVAAWDLVWKAIAVFVAVRNRQWKWAATLLTVSSAGVLPIVYLLRFAEPQEDEEAPEAAWAAASE